MGKCFSSHILHYEGSATPTLTTSPLPLHPASTTLAELPVQNPALLSGFASLFTESPVPVSPTLQLNGDLTDISQEQLAEVAVAELHRHLAVNFTSYIQEADNRVAVVAEHADDLHRFMESYGAVLKIEPILTRDFAAGIPTAEDITVDQTSQGLRILFQSRAPVDLSRCTYCGSCGPVCPEKCLQPDLFLDFASCSMCMECVHACPIQAIDLHARQQHSLLVPALLDLNGSFCEQETKNNKIFSPAGLEHLFGLLYPCQIEETIVCDKTICQYLGAFDAGCDLCFTACRQGAIVKGEDGIRIDPLSCVECGDCVAACPTGAIRFLRFEDRTFVEYLRDLSLAPGTTILIGSESSLRKLWWQYRDRKWNNLFFLEYPAPGALHSLHLLLLLATGAGRILVLAEKEHTPLNTQVDQVNTLMQSLFPRERPVRLVSLDEAPDFLNKPASSPLTDQYRDYSFAGRRDKVVSLLTFFMKQGVELPEGSASLFSEFGSLSCDTDHCSLCLACVGQCRTGALSADSEEFLLQLNGGLCIQCGACAELCPEKALTLIPGLKLEPEFFQSQALARAEPMRCADCGKVFGTRQSFEKVMSLLADQGRDVDREIFSCCEDCRVIRLYGGLGHE